MQFSDLAKKMKRTKKMRSKHMCQISQKTLKVILRLTVQEHAIITAANGRKERKAALNKENKGEREECGS